MNRPTPPGLCELYVYDLTNTTPNGRPLDRPALRTTALLVAGNSVVASGCAVLNPGDAFDASMGHEVARGRAVKALDATLTRIADSITTSLSAILRVAP